MADIPYLSTAGYSTDLETFAYMRNEFTILPDPGNNIPFNIQGQPIPDYQQVHVTSGQVLQATNYLTNNPWPFTRFVGKFQRQINQPQFLSINEQIYFQ